ncbi:CIC11C00000005836 [Sungouiella intermedia]|uniref:CIC11C00000005836 n=1 Tax=Sungouiella intermedia TaxID=45354 RepID=A0A1L0BPL8_9ASCO|nr:CIC11C00000005836 [[Candida] intermedia]
MLSRILTRQPCLPYLGQARSVNLVGLQVRSLLQQMKLTHHLASRHFQVSASALHGHIHKPKPGEELKITFITKDGTQHTFEVAEGDNLLDIAQAYNLDMEGACGGLCACSTCHIIVDPDFYDEIPEPDDDENDMLDLAFGLTETSRLGCQVKMSKELDGIRVALPAMTRNLQSKDFS